MKTQLAEFKLNPSVFWGLLFFHVGAIGAFFCFSWQNFFLFLFLYWLTDCVGITLCYHRYLTHRGFEMPKWLEYTCVVIATLTSQGGPIQWVATHRCHHAFSDQEGDPHSPRDGFWWSHMLWFVYMNPVLESHEFYEKYAPDLMKDRFYRFLLKYDWISQVVLGVILFLIGGLPWVFWGVFLRTVVALHATWLVNSASHIWGYQNFKNTRDNSKNLWWVALLSWGEGWHNNHHAHPRSARHGMKWWELDVTYGVILLFSWLKLAKNIKAVTI